MSDASANDDATTIRAKGSRRMERKTQTDNRTFSLSDTSLNDETNMKAKEMEDKQTKDGLRL